MWPPNCRCSLLHKPGFVPVVTTASCHYVHTDSAHFSSPRGDSLSQDSRRHLPPEPSCQPSQKQSRFLAALRFFCFDLYFSLSMKGVLSLQFLAFLSWKNWYKEWVSGNGALLRVKRKSPPRTQKGREQDATTERGDSPRNKDFKATSTRFVVSVLWLSSVVGKTENRQYDYFSNLTWTSRAITLVVLCSVWRVLISLFVNYSFSRPTKCTKGV